MAFIEREKEILRVLTRLVGARLDFIVVGGHAVSALARHRYSIDCDVVIKKKEMEEFENILTREGFTRHTERAGFDEVYGGEFVSYRKEVDRLPVTFDLLVGSLVYRTTDAAWSFDYIRRHSIEANVLGIETSVSCRVPEKELLIAFKVHSGRKADVRDMVMLRENADFKKVLDHLKRGRIDALRDQINNIIEALKDEKLVDSLKGVFTLTADVKRQIENTRKDMENLLKNFNNASKLTSVRP